MMCGNVPNDDAMQHTSQRNAQNQHRSMTKLVFVQAPRRPNHSSCPPGSSPSSASVWCSAQCLFPTAPC
eukprot:260322-Amphidinium_carterae.1